MRTTRSSLEELDYLRAQAVLDALAEIERDPEVGYRLRGRLTGPWSLRVGVYRIIYELREDDKTVRVIAIRHRTGGEHRREAFQFVQPHPGLKGTLAFILRQVSLQQV